MGPRTSIGSQMEWREYRPYNMSTIVLRVLCVLLSEWYLLDMMVKSVKINQLITVTSRMFTQPFVQAQIKENNEVSRHWP